MATDYLENMLIDGLLRGGCLTTAGAAGSSAVVKGIWTGTTPYALGDIVVPHASMTGAGGKLLRCTTAGTSGSSAALAVPDPGATLSDGTVTWTAIATVPALTTIYVALFLVAPDDAGAGGTEVSGGSYARVPVACTLAAWCGTQGTASTTASTGTGGTSSNNATITFPVPTADWGICVAFGIYDALTGGHLLYSAVLGATRTILNNDPAPTFAASALTLTAA